MPHGARRRVVVLISGAGSNLRALLDADLGADVVLVVSDRADAGGLQMAHEAGVPTAVVALASFPDRETWETALAGYITEAAPDLVVLAGFMRILSGAVVQRWPMLNVHPSLLPAFPGARAVRDALEHGVKVTGATVHFVDELVDHGPIVAQEAVPVRPDDDEETLHARIKHSEHRLLADAVAAFCNDRLRVTGRLVRRSE